MRLAACGQHHALEQGKAKRIVSGEPEMAFRRKQQRTIEPPVCQRLLSFPESIVELFSRKMQHS
jgi:hypothetical protein